jgi:hypothetical protein
MVSVVPGAIYSQLGKNYTVERWAYSNGLVLHVQEGNGRADNWFNHPECDNASSHWWVGKDGTIRQFLDPEMHQSWAQGDDGNSEWHSVETEGFTGEPLTTAQIAGVAAIYRWGMARFGWPAKEANFVDARGLGWHGMGGAAWGSHLGCPGNLRRAQRGLIIQAATNYSDTQENENMDWNYVYANKVTNPNRVGFAETTWGTNYAAWEALKEVKELRAQVQQLLDIVGRLQ